MLFAAALEAASNGEEQTQTSPENRTQITRSRTIKICGLEQPRVGEFKTLLRPCLTDSAPNVSELNQCG
jgi:hypothetical protein